MVGKTVSCLKEVVWVWGKLIAHNMKERDSLDICVLSRQLSVNREMQPRSHMGLVYGLENAIMSCFRGDGPWQERCR